jgi:hypothetical protein
MADGLDVSGLNQLAIEVGTLPARGLAAARVALAKTAADIEADAKSFVPVDTGNLRASHLPDRVRAGRGDRPHRGVRRLRRVRDQPAGSGGVHGPSVRPPRRWPRAGPSADRRRLVAGVSRRVIAAAIEARLREDAPMVNVYVGAVPDTPPADPDGRVHVYAVLYPGPGTIDAGPVGAHRRRAPMDGSGHVRRR